MGKDPPIRTPSSSPIIIIRHHHQGHEAAVSNKMATFSHFFFSTSHHHPTINNSTIISSIKSNLTVALSTPSTSSPVQQSRTPSARVNNVELHRRIPEVR